MGTKDRIDQEKTAVALSYKAKNQAAPEVVAKGKGALAQKILALASEHDVAIHEDKDLVVLLEHVDLGDEIPVEAFMAVAEIFSYLYKTNKAMQNGGAVK